MNVSRILGTYQSALDEIALFWYKNIGFMQLYLISAPICETSYVFTAAMYVDYDANELFPFLLMGNRHIIDDPLGSFLEIYNDISENNGVEIFNNYVVKIIENDIKILSLHNADIIIAPVRLINQPRENGDLKKIGESAFVSIFNDINSIDDYFRKCRTTEDILQYSKDESINGIILYDGDNNELPLAERIERAVGGLPDKVKSSSEVENFFMVVFGNIMQAIDTIVSCIEYSCVPYVTNSVALYYASSILTNLDNENKELSLEYRMCIAFLLHKLCDKTQLSIIEINDYIKKVQEYNFDERLFRSLGNNGIDKFNFKHNNITDLLESELKKLYDYLV